ncbi:UNVERIFIED_CONTAM: hypothetical protein GN151_16135 [Acinetobacter sp. HSTU-ASm16]
MRGGVGARGGGRAVRRGAPRQSEGGRDTEGDGPAAGCVVCHGTSVDPSHVVCNSEQQSVMHL